MSDFSYSRRDTTPQTNVSECYDLTDITKGYKNISNFTIIFAGIVLIVMGSMNMHISNKVSSILRRQEVIQNDEGDQTTLEVKVTCDQDSKLWKLTTFAGASGILLGIVGLLMGLLGVATRRKYKICTGSEFRVGMSGILGLMILTNSIINTIIADDIPPESNLKSMVIANMAIGYMSSFILLGHAGIGFYTIYRGRKKK
jgi:hypothetical protein